LVAIADAAGGEWPERARRAASALEGSSDDDAVGVVLLQDLAELFAHREADRLSSEEIVEALASMDDRPWPECNHGKPISKSGLAKILKPFKIHSRNIKTAAGKVVKGYPVEDFTQTFARYISSQNATPLPSNVYSGFDDFRTATAHGQVALPNCTKTNRDGRGSGVAFQEPPNDGFDEEEHF
jgi:hypothetical protein